MGDSKRWTVTYTKHIKQKRKVYQDGALERHNNKVLLYDDTGKVIGSRFLKKDEVVRCGETLTFDGHLVDIGDYEGKDLNVQGGDKKPVEITSTWNGFKKVDADNIGRPKNRTLHVMNKVDAGSGHIGEAGGQFKMLKKIKQEDEKSEPHNFRAPRSRLEAIKINDRGNKQYGLQNFEASKNCSNPTQTTAREWHALYTTQLTQKAKKYHDGIIRLEFCGAIQKQVLLYDASRKLLDSRFLKKDEVVRSGETVVFDGHLVEVGDPEEDKKSELHNSRAPQSLLKATKIIDRGIKLYGPQYFEESRNCSNPTQTTASEWPALYTTHLTQKAKKYHDGFIRLELCGSYQKQVVLYDASRKVLDSRFLKKDEVVISGVTVVFAAHLVEIGEHEASSLDSTTVVASKHADATAGEGLVKSSREWHALYTTQVTQKAKKYHDGILQLAVCVSHRKQVILLNEDGNILSRKYLNSYEDVKAGCTLQVTNYLVQVGEVKISRAGESQNDVSSGKHVTEGACSSRFSVDKIKLSHSDATKKPIGESQDDASSGKHVTMGAYSSRFGVDKIKLSTSDATKKPTGESQNNVYSEKHVTVGSYSSSFSVDKIKLSPSDASKKPISDGQAQDDTSSEKHVGAYSSSFSVDKTKFSVSDAMKKQIRDVHQIMSTLKKPMSSESLAPTRKPTMDQIFSSRSSDSSQFGLEKKLLGHNAQELKSSWKDDHEDSRGHLNGDSDRQMGYCRSGIAESKAPQRLPTSGIINLIDPDHSDRLDPHTTLSNVSLGVAASDIPTSKSDWGNPDKTMVNTYSSITKPQDSDAVLDLSDRSTVNPFSSVARPQVSDLVLDTPEDTRAEGSGGRIAQDVKEEKSNQVSADKMGNEKRLDGLSFGWSSTIDAALDSPSDAERQSCELLKSIPEEKLEIDEYPSFDLGF